MSLSRSVFDLLSDYPEISRSKRILLACSGGLDSMVLLDCLRRWPGREAEIVICHVNFGLRGEESERDAEFIQHYANVHELPCMIRRVAAEERQSSGVQEWARDLRYNWFEELLGPGDYLALAHQNDDLMETILMRISRGKGLGQLRGMKTLQGAYWRPMLGLRRSEILEIATTEKILHREDSSNAKLEYSRNRIRHRILPELEDIFPGFRKNLLDLACAGEEWIYYFQSYGNSLPLPASPSEWQRVGEHPGCQVLVDTIRAAWGLEVSRPWLVQVYQKLCTGESGVFQLNSRLHAKLKQGIIEFEVREFPVSARWKQFQQELLKEELPHILGPGSILVTDLDPM